MINKEYIRDLVEQFVYENDQIAAKKIFNIYYQRLIQYALIYVKYEDAAEDVVSDVFFKIFKKPSKILDIEDLTYYLYKSVKNQCLTYISKNLRYKIERDFDESYFNNVFVEAINPENELITNELIDAIKQLISDFPPRRKLIYNMIVTEELSYKEVAQLLNISVKTVDNQLSTAVKCLRLGILDHFKE